MSMDQEDSFFGFTYSTWKALGIDQVECTKEVYDTADAITREMVEQNSEFSPQVLIALIGLLIEAIKLYRECKKSPTDIHTEIQSGFAFFRPLRRLKAKRLFRKYFRPKGRNALSDEIVDCSFDATLEILSKYTPEQIAKLTEE